MPAVVKTPASRPRRGRIFIGRGRAGAAPQTSPLPAVQYLIAFQNNPMDDPALIFEPPPPGVLGAPGQWTDITPYVSSHHMIRGRQHELAQFEAGSLDLKLNNQDGRFNSWNTTGPYSGFLQPRKLAQLRVQWNGVTYTRFTGHVNAWPIDWSDPISGFASCNISDAFRLFNNANITHSAYPAQILADGATGYWRLGDIGPLVALDSSTGGHNGTYQGTETFGQPGALPADPTTSVNFANGSTPTGEVFIPAGAGITSQTFSIEAWVKSSSWVWGYVWDQYSVAGGEIQSQLNHNTGVPAIEVIDEVGDICVWTATSAVPGDGNWHHVVWVVTAATSCSIYLDGVALGVTPSISGVPAAFTPVSCEIAGPAAVPSDPLFTGFMQEVAVYSGVALTAAQVSNHFTLGTFPQQSTDARIASVLNVLGWPASARTLDAGASTVQAVTTALTTTSSLSHMQAVEGTEGGGLFMTGTGKVRFLSRQTVLSGSLYTSPQQTIGDNLAGGDMPFQPAPQIGIDDIDLYNEATATRQGGNNQTFSDTASITSYGRQTWTPPTTLLGISDTEVLSRVEYVVAKFKTPVVRIQSVTVDLTELITPNLVAHLLSLDLLYQVTVERTSPPGGGTGFSQIANIERIEETVTPSSWMTTFQLAVADPAWWVLGTSQLGSQTRIAY